MCDTNKFFEMYKEIKELTPDDTLQLVMEARDDEESEFFMMVGNFLLQQKQQIAIKENRF